MGEATADTYAIIGGGMLRRIELALRVARDDARDLPRRLLILFAVSYAPVLAMGLVHRVQTSTMPIVLDEASTHVRSLVVLPLLLVAEMLMNRRSEEAGSYLLHSGLVAPQRLDVLRDAIARTVRMRDSMLDEGALLLVALVSVVTLPPMTRDLHPDAQWSLVPGVFLARFLLLRLLWRWLLWGLYLARIVRLPLECRVTHPDRVAGLAPLAGPSFGFALSILAIGGTISASWGDRMRFEGLDPKSVLAPLVAYAAIAVSVACAPLASLTPLLFRLRWKGVHEMGAFASRYSDAFEHRWLHARGVDALGAPDISGMNDLGGAFERAEQIKLIVLPHPLLRMLVACVAVPFLPLAVAALGPKAVILSLAHALL
jgi:hypothetical protein